MSNSKQYFKVTIFFKVKYLQNRTNTDSGGLINSRIPGFRFCSMLGLAGLAQR